VLLGWRAAILGEDGTQNLLHGRDTTISAAAGDPIATGALCRAYSDAGDFLAVLRHEAAGRWRPEKVFAAQ
jgi:hypothetical protein